LVANDVVVNTSGLPYRRTQRHMSMSDVNQ
jgi:hypothetical protein